MEEFKPYLPHIDWLRYLYDHIETGFPTKLVSSEGDSSPITPYNELIVAQKTTVIELKSIYGLSDIRDHIFENGTGTVINDFREYILNISGVSSFARLESVERGRYIAGKSGEYGMGMRLSSDIFTGDTDAKWGAINIDNGMYFGQDSDGKYVAVLDDTTENKIHQQDWNVDKLDGTGPSGLTLDTTVGNIYNVIFSWYGYGVINFKVLIKTVTGMRSVICHRYIIDNQTSIKNPNLPLTGSISQTSSSNNETMYIGGRQFSVLGTYNPSYRSTSDYVIGKVTPTLATSTTPTPIMSFKQKPILNGVNSKISGVDVSTSEKIVVELYIADETSLTGPVWETPTRKKPNETAFEVDFSATNFDLSNANMLYRVLISGGDKNNTTNNKELDGIILDIPEGKIVVLAAFGVTLESTVDILLRIREEW